MDRMKTFGLYALCIILFFIFSNIMINLAIKTSYSPINVNIETRENIDINITTAKATYVNGIIEGRLKNTGANIDKLYVKIDLYSERDILLGTKYVEINDFRQGENREFEMGFKFTDVDYAKIKLVKEPDVNATNDNFVSDKIKGFALITAVIFLCYF